MDASGWLKSSSSSMKVTTTSMPAMSNSNSDSNVTTVISEELMAELQHRDKALLQRERELEATQKRFRHEKAVWSQHLHARKEQLKKTFEQDKARFEEALMTVTQRDLNQLVEEHESYRRALLAVIAVFHLKCMAFDIDLLTRVYLNEDILKVSPKSENVPCRLPALSTVVHANRSRGHEVVPIFLCWMIREMEHLEGYYFLALQRQTIPSSGRIIATVASNKRNHFLKELDDYRPISHTRNIFISILTLEVAFFVGVLYFVYDEITSH